jgi:hypothetical protein
MRKRIAALLASAFVVALLASPALAKVKPSSDGRAGSTIVAGRS